jgi:hypothetical protein
MYGLRAWRNRDPVSSSRNGAETAVPHSRMGFEQTKDFLAFTRRQMGQVNFLFPGTLLTAHGFLVWLLFTCSFLALLENFYPRVGFRSSGVNFTFVVHDCVACAYGINVFKPVNGNDPRGVRISKPDHHTIGEDLFPICRINNSYPKRDLCTDLRYSASEGNRWTRWL